ncbi:MAG: restriction endonuclease subunit M [Caulobacterales bacterium]
MASNRDDSSQRADLWRTLEVELDPAGRIVDFLNPKSTRPDGPEERVRQHYARILVEEYGYSRDMMAFEVPIHIGRDVKKADIAIFKSAEAAADRVQGQISLVVETKSPTQSEGLGQLTSYIFASSASGGVWFNLDVAYFRRFDLPEQELRPWTNIPRRGETWDAVGHYGKDQLRRPVDLKRVFQRCHNAIYRSGSDSEDIALDMVRIILAKYRDEQNPGTVCDFRCTPEEFQGELGRRAVGNRVRALFAQVARDHPDVFPASEQITLSDDNLAIVVSEIQQFRFLSEDEAEQVYDVIGTAFEVYVAAHLKGSRGQYFTNRLVVNMMVAMMNPDERDIIYDPACGSGGFLIAALRYVRTRILTSGRIGAAKQREIRNASERLFGTDIAPKLVRVAKTNMILNGDGHGGIVQANSLLDLDGKVSPASPLRSDAAPNNRPTCILMNPPFGASHDLRERNRNLLERYQLGHVWTPGLDGWLLSSDALNSAEGVPPEILFLEQAIRLLAARGRMAIVIARGVLDNRDALAAREFILKSCRVLGIINCHHNTFAPFNGTKASILFLEKKAAPGFARDEDYPVFMAISQKVGQDSMGREIHRRNDDGELMLVHGSR